jgi:hypothetical protein
MASHPHQRSSAAAYPRSFEDSRRNRRACNYVVCFTSSGGAGGARTPDLRLAKAALSQLSYGPLESLGYAYSPRRANGGPSWTRTRDLSLIRTAL